MKSILEIKNLKGRTAVVRVDFNVPIGQDGIIDETESIRILKSLDTIKHLKNIGSKVVLISHFGSGENQSLRPVAEFLNKYIEVDFIPLPYGQEILDIVENMGEGKVVLLENLRLNEGEEKNTEEFAGFLASLGDLYINEAFSVSHREHASIVGVPKFLPSYVGFWFLKEIENLKKMDNPEKPFLFILGGAKFDTKIKLIDKFSSVADNMFIGGALANNFFKEIGFETGKSLIDQNVKVSKYFNNENIKVPFDVLLEDGSSISPNMIPKDGLVVDMGEDTLEELKSLIKSSKTVLWNGPLGLYEKGFDKSSKEILKIISESPAFSVVGGGDSVKLLIEMGLYEKISFVSTGGGAMLEFLSNGTLPGIDALG